MLYATQGESAAQAHILVVDDDPDDREEIGGYLSGQDFRVSLAEGGETMRRVLDKDAVDLVILDLMMPGEKGLALTSDIRKSSDVGIIILTGQGDAFDKVVGLELGADDYMAKPCNLRELLARIRSILRRAGQSAKAEVSGEGITLSFEGWTFDMSKRRLTDPVGQDVDLTSAGFNLLAVFAGNPNRVLSRNQLLDLTQNRDWSPFDRSIDNMISRLRAKIETNRRRPSFIKTVRGADYMFTPKVTRL